MHISIPFWILFGNSFRHFQFHAWGDDRNSSPIPFFRVASYGGRDEKKLLGGESANIP